jgi:uncharacterized membrane protein YphA (DoxX/SURF4 family)
VVQKGYSKPTSQGHSGGVGRYYHEAVQRLFSMFPTGLPGTALFLLRVSVIGILVDSTIQSSTIGNVSPWRILALAPVTVLLFCGVFTPFASIVSFILEAICWPAWDGLRSFEFSLRALVMIALFLLGPGAYSVDSKMFGRRLILPPK